MHSSSDSRVSALFTNGRILVRFPDGLEISFPVASNPRLAPGTPSQLSNIVVSPFGLHWPELDEDLSFEGLANGDFGQFCVPSAPKVAEGDANYGA